jgi:CRISPR/Cas system-associated protein Cas7 (RAMP superfamily)
MSNYKVCIRDAHAYSLTGRSFECFVGEIVRVDTGKVAYRTKFYEEKRAAHLQAARYIKRYEQHLAKHGIGFEEQEEQRKAAERAERDAKRANDRRVREAAPDLLVALQNLLDDALVAGLSDSTVSGSIFEARAAIRKAKGAAI